MTVTERIIAMFLVGSGLTFVEMITLYQSATYPAIISILLFIAFSLFNGFIFTEAVDNANKNTR